MKNVLAALFEKLQNHSATILNGFFAVTALIYALLQMPGWELIAFNHVVVWVIFSAVVLTLFVLAYRPSEYTSRVKGISCNLLPMTGALFGLWAVDFFSDYSALGAVLAVGAVAAGMTLGFNYGDGDGLGCLSKIVGAVLSVLILAVMGLSSMMGGVFDTKPVSEAVSPDGLYTASAYSADLGATGASSAVSVTRCKRVIPTPVGWICDVDEAVVHTGEHNTNITVSWQDEDTLLIGTDAKEMSEYFD